MLNLALAGALALASPITSLDQAIEICRTVYFINHAKGVEMFNAVPEDQKPTVGAICAAYRQGAADLAKSMQAQN
jgi:hypothetical protein